MKRFALNEKRVQKEAWVYLFMALECVFVCVRGQCTGAAGVVSLSFILTAAARLISQILKIHLHLFADPLDGALR